MYGIPKPLISSRTFYNQKQIKYCVLLNAATLKLCNKKYNCNTFVSKNVIIYI